MNPKDLKRCTRCNEVKTIEQFGKNSGMTNGRLNQCKLCVSTYNKKWREKNRETILQKKREYYYVNREHSIFKARQWAINNPERINERNKKWKKENPDAVRSMTRNRRARIKKARGTHSGKDIKLIYKRQKGRCYWCLVSLKDTYTVDHRIPISRGGSNDASNLVVTCPHCNYSKNNKLPHEWNGRLL